MTPIKVSLKDLRLADTVKLFDGPWGYGIVTQLSDKEITIIRPYGTTADFSYTGGVIFYTGQESIVLHVPGPPVEYEVHDRKPLR